MIIYDIYEKQILDVPVTRQAKHEQEMMKSDFVQLSWNDTSKKVLEAGTFIIPFDDGVRFRLLDDYIPKCINETKYEYTPEFQHPVMMLGKIPFILVSGDTHTFQTADKETDWVYTGVATTIIQRIVDFINTVGKDVDDIGTGWVAVVDADLIGSKTCTFSSVDVLSAITECCNQWDCEAHLDYDTKVLYFGKVATGEAVTLKVGENIGIPSVRESKEGYYNAYLVKGSTRNISQKNASGENTQVNKRLTLDPVKYPYGYIDRRESTFEPLMVKELILEDVYPHLDLYVYDARSRVRYLKDDDGKKVLDTNGNPRKYAVWYIRLAYYQNGVWMDYRITDEQVIDGKNLSISFQPNEENGALPSPLAGREFELRYHKTAETIKANAAEGDTGIDIKAGDYEIVFEQADLIIPTTTEGELYPRGEISPSKKGNKVLLFNIAMGAQYQNQAYLDLEAAGLKEIERLETDLNNYTFPSNPVVFEDAKQNPNLTIGRRVLYDDGQGYTLETRVMKLVTQLDFKFQQTITIGNEQIKGTISEMREQIQQIVTGGGGTGSGGGLSVSDLKNMLMYYGRNYFLSKQGDDNTPFSLSIGQNLNVSGNTNTEGNLDVGGNAKIGGDVDIDGFLKVLAAYINKLQSSDYTGDGLADTGFKLTNDKDGHSYLVVDELMVRMKAVFNELEVRKMTYSGGNVVYSGAGSKIFRVEYLKKITPDAANGELLGYTTVKVPWLLYGSPLAIGNYVLGSRKKIRTEVDMNEVTHFRCYLIADDGTQATCNWWEEWDQARCQTFNLSKNGRDGANGTDSENIYDIDESGLQNNFYWRLVSRAGQQKLEDDLIYNYVDLSKEDCLKGSGIPVAGDSIVQFGNRKKAERQNLITLEVVGEDAPAIKEYMGVNSYDLTNKRKTMISPKSGDEFYATRFVIVTSYGAQVPIPVDRGAWLDIPTDSNGKRRCYYYDRVSHSGSIWLCMVADGWHYEDSNGNIVSADTEGAIRTRNYTTDEPSDTSSNWLKQVSKGTEITQTIVRYAASKSGTAHPEENSSLWKETIEQTGVIPGQYLWTRKMTFYSDNRTPSVEYSCSRWGIDGDGIASINSYYWMTDKVDADPSTVADENWVDTYSDLGDLGGKQGWYIWEKTVIKYDVSYDADGKIDTKPDVVTYRVTRLGTDGQIGMEEYYCLRSSNDFNEAFGGYTYNKCGIRWYVDGNPNSENGRLSGTKPNINTDLWTPSMPVYAGDDKKYLWNFEQRVDGQGTQFATKPICIGNHARGIAGILELYALSASKTPVSANVPIPADINRKNTMGVIPTTNFDDVQVWGDERYDRAPNDQYPYQWNWTRTLYSDGGHEDHYHISAVKGTKGEDGAGTEYIYKVTATDENPGKPSNNGTVNGKTRDDDDFIPSGWTDNPQGVDRDNRFEWVSQRTKATGGTWGDFQTPALWSAFGQQGIDGDGMEYVFARTVSNTPPVVNSNSSDGSSRTYLDDEYLPAVTGAESSRCTDDPKGVTREWPYEWVITRKKGSPNKYGEREWEKYSGSMSLWSKWAEDGDTPISVFRWYAPNAVIPANIGTGYPPSGWYKYAPNRPADGYHLYMSTSIQHADGTRDAWSVPTRISGETGTPGEDATDREYIYKASSELPKSSDCPTATTNSKGGKAADDDFVPDGWFDNPQGVTKDVRYEWMCWREKPQGANVSGDGWGAFQGPIVWSAFGQQGIDGDGMEYVFARTGDESTIPNIGNSSKNGKSFQDPEYLPTSSNSEWFDDPQGTDETNKVEWVSVRKKINGTWQAFQAPAIWSRYVKDGENGKDGYTFTLSPASIIIGQSVTSPYSMIIDATPNGNTSTGITVKKGNRNCSVSINSLSSYNCNVSRYYNGSYYSSRFWITAVLTDPDGNYYESGYVDVTFNVTDPDSNSVFSHTLRFAFYCNLMGTFKQVIEGDVETSIANKKYYVYDENGNVVSYQTLAEYIRSSSINSATLRKDVDGQTESINKIEQTATKNSASIEDLNGNVSNIVQTQNQISMEVLETQEGYYQLLDDAELKVGQKGAWDMVNGNYRVLFAYYSGSMTLRISAPNLWSISSDSSWCTVNQTQGSGEIFTTLSVSYNYGSGRTAVLTLTYDGKTEYIYVYQYTYGYSYTTDNKSLNSCYSIFAQASTIEDRNVLEQEIYRPDETVLRIRQGRWYTFSFYVCGSGSVRTFVYPGCVDTDSPVYADGNEEKGQGDGCRDWNLTANWVRHIYTFRAKDSFTYDIQRLLFRLLKGTSEVYIVCPRLELGMVAHGWGVDMLGLKRTGIDIKNGKIILDAETAEATGNFIVKKLLTNGGDTGVHVEIQDGVMNVFGSSGVANWRFGVDDEGNAILSYYDNTGTKVYDLGPEGLTKINNTSEAFIADSENHQLKTIGATDNVDTAVRSVLSSATMLAEIFKQGNTANTYYRYRAKKTVTDGTTVYYEGTYASSANIAKAADQKLFIARGDVNSTSKVNAICVLMAGNITDTHLKSCPDNSYEPYKDSYATKVTWGGSLPIYCANLRVIQNGVVVKYLNVWSNTKY